MGIIAIKSRGINQDGKVVLELARRIMVYKREHAPQMELFPHEYSPKEMAEIERVGLDEPNQVRGRETRYWDDVRVGEELPPIVRGPLSLMDTMGWLVGCGRGHTHGVLLHEAVKHPNHYFRNPEAGGGIEYTGIGHHRDSVAQEVRSLGFTGKLAIHPRQLPVIHQVFFPTPAEIEWARKVVAAFATAEARGVAAVQVDAKFVDYPVAARAQSLLARVETQDEVK